MHWKGLKGFLLLRHQQKIRRSSHARKSRRKKVRGNPIAPWPLTTEGEEGAARRLGRQFGKGAKKARALVSLTRGENLEDPTTTDGKRRERIIL